MSDIYRGSVERKPQYQDRVGYSLAPSVGRAERAASPAMTALTLAAVVVGGALVAMAVVRCASEDAAREDLHGSSAAVRE